MTTPGGVPNLPQGALTIDTLESKTQDMSPTAMKSRASERISSIFGGSTGSDPMSAITPFGFLTGLFAGFQSTVANADPNDINGPEDLPGLLTDFIESLPVVGEFVRLFDAIRGTYEGDDQTLLAVQSFFVSLRSEIEQAQTKADAAADKWAQSIDQLLGMGHGVEDFINMLQGLRDGNLSVLAPANTNRLDNPNFNGALSLSDPSGDFVWDATVSRSGGAGSGSARADADGNEKELRSNKVSVAAGQVWTFVANIASVGLAGTGSLVQLTALPFDSAGNELPPIVLASSGVPTGSGVWVSPPAGANKTAQLTSDWAVPAGVTRVSLRMVLTATATAGRIWLDDMSLAAKNPIPQDWVKNLVADLNTAFTRFTQMGQIVGGQIVTAFDDFVQQFKDWWTSNLGPNAIKAKADQNAAWAARKAQNDKILNDWSFYYPFGSPTDTAATLVGGKRTKWGAWNDNIAIITEQLGFAPPTAPLVDLGAKVSDNETAASLAAATASAAGAAASLAQATNQDLTNKIIGSQTGVEPTNGTPTQAQSALMSIPYSNIQGQYGTTPIFGAIGAGGANAGNNFTPISTSWTHTPAAADTMVIAFVEGYGASNNPGTDPLAGTNITCSWGGTAMTPVGDILPSSGQSQGGGWAWVRVFYIRIPAGSTTTKTLQATVSAYAPSAIKANSYSCSGSKIAAYNYALGSGASSNQSITATGTNEHCLCIGFLGGLDMGSWSWNNGGGQRTQRWYSYTPSTAFGANISCILGDATPASGVTTQQFLASHSPPSPANPQFIGVIVQVSN